ncbi:hypothetical protein scyTo_0023338, partial [Scyliorhinus torazame]|nr:hypothetical protein [Scyliorhinus torazame]
KAIAAPGLAEEHNDEQGLDGRQSESWQQPEHYSVGAFGCYPMLQCHK